MLKKILKKNRFIVSAGKKVKGFKNVCIRVLNRNIIKHVSPSSRYLGAPKNELFTWQEVENYIVQSQNSKQPPFLKKLHVQQLTFRPPILTIGKPEPGAELEPKQNVYYCEYVCLFPNGRISMRDFNIVTEDDFLIQPLSNYYGHQPNSHVLYTKIKLPVPKKLTGKTLFLKGWGDAYYHIMHDAVCAVKLVQDAGIDIDSIDNILVFEYKEDWYNKVYSKLGLPKNKFIDGQGKNVYECEQLIVASYFEHHGIWYSDFLKTIFLPKSVLKNKYGKKLFISRAKALTRRILNEDEVISFLGNHGFSVVYAEDLTIEEQASIYNNAECIIAVHGANLVNVLFCNPGTKICEIRYTKHAMYYKKLYYEIAQNCKLQYYLFYADEGRLSTSKDIFDSDIYVNINDLSTMLFSMDCQK
jgi:capsular polysaccharide biosynthesis protein